MNTRFVPYLISSATVISYELFSAVLAPFFKPTCLYLNSLGQLEMVVKFADEVEHNLLVPDEEIPNALTRLIEGSCITHSPELQQLAEAGRASHHPNLQMLLKEALRDYTNNTPFPNLVHYIAAVTKQLEHERSQGHQEICLAQCNAPIYLAITLPFSIALEDSCGVPLLLLSHIVSHRTIKH